MSLWDEWIDKEIRNTFPNGCSLPVGKPATRAEQKMFGGFKFVFAKGYWVHRLSGGERDVTINIHPDCDSRDAHLCVVEIQRVRDDYPNGIGAIRGLNFKIGHPQPIATGSMDEDGKKNLADLVIACSDWRHGALTLYNEPVTGRLYAAAIELATAASAQTRGNPRMREATRLRNMALNEIAHLYLKVPGVNGLARRLAESLAKADQRGELMRVAESLNPLYLPDVIQTWRAKRPDLHGHLKKSLDMWVARELTAELLATIKWENSDVPEAKWPELKEVVNLLDAEDRGRPRYARRRRPGTPDRSIRLGCPSFLDDDSVVVMVGGKATCRSKTSFVSLEDSIRQDRLFRRATESPLNALLRDESFG